MRKIKIALMLVFFIIQGILSFEATAALNYQDDGEPIDLKTRPERPHSFYSPTYCYFSNGYLQIMGGNNITSIKTEVIRLDDNAKWGGSESDCTQTLYITEEQGDYSIKVTLSDGRTYYGLYLLR